MLWKDRRISERFIDKNNDEKMSLDDYEEMVDEERKKAYLDQ